MEVAKCHTMQCSAGTVLNPVNMLAPCSNHPCMPADEDTCCMAGTLCTEYDNLVGCPGPYKLRPDHDNILCEEVGCTNTPYDTCCAQKQKCSELKCPDGWLQKREANHSEYCANFECNDDDAAVCCDAAMSCDQFDCCGGIDGGCGYAWKADYLNLRCKERTCKFRQGRGDFLRCCDQQAECRTHNCPTGYVEKDDMPPGTLKCSGKRCASGTATQPSVDDGLCCEARDNCDNFACNATSHLPIVSTVPPTLCAGASCGAADEIQCCMKKARCVTDTVLCTKTGYAKHLLNAVRYCKGSEQAGCNEDDDLDWCCQQQAQQQSDAGQSGPAATTTTVDEELETENGARRLHGAFSSTLTLLLAFLGMLVKM